MVRAVVDRFEGQFAVLIVEGQSKPVDVPSDRLPNGIHEGDHLQVEFQDDQLIDIQRDPEATEQARRRIQDKVNRLRRGDHLPKEES